MLIVSNPLQHPKQMLVGNQSIRKHIQRLWWLHGSQNQYIRPDISKDWWFNISELKQNKFESIPTNNSLQFSSSVNFTKEPIQINRVHLRNSRIWWTLSIGTFEFEWKWSPLYIGIYSNYYSKVHEIFNQNLTPKSDVTVTGHIFAASRFVWAEIWPAKVCPTT